MKISKRDAILLAIVGTIAVLGGFWWFYVKPAQADLSAVKEEITRVEDTNAGLQDTLDRLAADRVALAPQTAEEIRLAEAVPDSAQVPAAIVQLQRLADRSNVEFSSIQAGQVSDLQGFVGRQFLVEVTGRFFDVDDFLYRMHNLVTVNAKGRPVIRGRLFAVTKIEMSLKSEGAAAPATSGLDDRDHVKAIVTVVVFSTGSAAPTPSQPMVSPDLNGGQPAPAQPVSATPGDPNAAQPAPAADPNAAAPAQPAPADNGAAAPAPAPDQSTQPSTGGTP